MNTDISLGSNQECKRIYDEFMQSLNKYTNDISYSNLDKDCVSNVLKILEQSNFFNELYNYFSRLESNYTFKSLNIQHVHLLIYNFINIYSCIDSNVFNNYINLFVDRLSKVDNNDEFLFYSYMILNILVSNIRPIYKDNFICLVPQDTVAVYVIMQDILKMYKRKNIDIQYFVKLVDDSVNASKKKCKLTIQYFIYDMLKSFTNFISSNFYGFNIDELVIQENYAVLVDTSNFLCLNKVNEIFFDKNEIIEYNKKVFKYPFILNDLGKCVNITNAYPRCVVDSSILNLFVKFLQKIYRNDDVYSVIGKNISLHLSLMNSVLYSLILREFNKGNRMFRLVGNIVDYYLSFANNDKVPFMFMFYLICMMSIEDISYNLVVCKENHILIDSTVLDNIIDFYIYNDSDVLAYILSSYVDMFDYICMINYIEFVKYLSKPSMLDYLESICVFDKIDEYNIFGYILPYSLFFILMLYVPVYIGKKRIDIQNLVYNIIKLYNSQLYSIFSIKGSDYLHKYFYYCLKCGYKLNDIFGNFIFLNIMKVLQFTDIEEYFRDDYIFGVLDEMRSDPMKFRFELIESIFESVFSSKSRVGLIRTIYNVLDNR